MLNRSGIEATATADQLATAPLQPSAMICRRSSLAPAARRGRRPGIGRSRCTGWAAWRRKWDQKGHHALRSPPATLMAAAPSRFVRIATNWSQIIRYILLSSPPPRIAKDRRATEPASASSARAIKDIRAAAHRRVPEWRLQPRAAPARAWRGGRRRGRGRARESGLGLIVALHLWWNALQREAILRERITAIGRRGAYARVAHLLCEIFERLRLVGETVDHSYRLPVTQAELGDALGLSEVHANRMLRRLQSERLIVYKVGI